MFFDARRHVTEGFVEVVSLSLLLRYSAAPAFGTDGGRVSALSPRVGDLTIGLDQPQLRTGSAEDSRD